ncbi:MAG TPA: hypothetical protein VGH13_19745 [Xanthobacteraceae bacterium]
MYLLLLVFGAILTAAGVLLSASGISIHERGFDTTILTPGIVAVIGGLVLIGLGLALRVLQRIEIVLATQPMPRPARFKESAETDMAPEFTVEPARASIPRTAVRTPLSTRLAAAGAHPSSVGPPKAFAYTPPDASIPAEVRAEQAPAEASASDKAETVHGAEKDLESELAAGLAAALALDMKPADMKPAGADSPLLPVAELNVGNELGLSKTTRTLRRLNGTTPVRTTPRLDLSARFPLASDRAASERLSPERPKAPSLDSLWPKGPRSLRATAPAAPQPVPAPTAVAPTADFPANKESADAVIVKTTVAPAATAPVETPHPVSVLKSGVVDGMAYTLFSDGSIEAALPQGTLRFGSISELRQHIEQSEQSA